MQNINEGAVEEIIRLAKAAQAASPDFTNDEIGDRTMAAISGTGPSLFTKEKENMDLREYVYGLSDEDELHIAALMYEGREMYENGKTGKFDLEAYDSQVEQVTRLGQSPSQAMLSKSLKLADYLELGLSAYQEYLKSR